MKEIIQQLEEWNENIKFDISQHWNDNKAENMVQHTSLTMAIALLKSVGRNDNNIPE